MKKARPQRARLFAVLLRLLKNNGHESISHRTFFTPAPPSQSIGHAIRASAVQMLLGCRNIKTQKTDMGDYHPCPFLIPKNGGPGRPRTYDNPVMSRGLYQLSYGSSSGKYAPILPVWQEKKRHILRKCFLEEPPTALPPANKINLAAYCRNARFLQKPQKAGP